MLPVHCVAYVGRERDSPRVKIEQNALPFPLSNARRQLSALQPGPYSRVAEVEADVCRVEPDDVNVIREEVDDGEN